MLFFEEPFLTSWPQHAQPHDKKTIQIGASANLKIPIWLKQDNGHEKAIFGQKTKFKLSVFWFLLFNSKNTKIP